MWGALLLDILANNRDWCSATATGKIALRPKTFLREVFGNRRMFPFANETAGDSFQAVYKRRNGDLGLVINQEMDMVVLSAELDQLRLKVFTDTEKYFLQLREYLFGKDSTSVFGYKDQMYMQIKNAVASVANFI